MTGGTKPHVKTYFYSNMEFINQKCKDSIENLYSNMVYNRALLDYLQAEILAVRMDYLDDFYSLVASNRKINKNILNISLYNSDDELIASKGELFVLLHLGPTLPAFVSPNVLKIMVYNSRMTKIKCNCIMEKVEIENTFTSRPQML